MELLMSPELPIEYTSLLHLRSKGDVGVVEACCEIWNVVHPGDALRVDLVDREYGII